MRESKFGLIQSPVQADLDRIAEEIVEYLGADMALLSVTHNSAMVSLGVSKAVKHAEMERTHMLEDMVCTRVVNGNAPVILEDARSDALARDMPKVRDGLVGGYIGVPIRSAEIGAIGAICGVTRAPRVWTEADIKYLKTIAETVENMILREMYRLESLDASTRASEYDQIIAAFALVRAEATSIHDGTGRLVFANRTLTDQVAETELESRRMISVLRAPIADGSVRYRASNGVDYDLTRTQTGSGYFVSQWRPVRERLN